MTEATTTPDGPEPEPAPARAKPEREGHDWVEILCAALLGIAGALTAFSAYKAALTDGDALKGYTESSQSTAEAEGYYQDYAQTWNADKQLFLQYVLTAQENPDTALGIRELFFDENLEAATVAWEAIPTDESPPTALDVDEYQTPSLDEYEALVAQAETQFDEAAKADNAGDKFEQASVFLAVSLFLAGIASLFKIPAVRWGALVLAAVSVVPGVMSMLDGQSALG